jgi:hypothetical protein
MLLGMLCLFMGYQTLWLGAFAKIHGWVSGILPGDTFSVRIFDHVNLERGLVAGGALVTTGLALCGWLIVEWWQVNLGALDVAVTMRYALWAFTTTVLGMQTIFCSFFLSMLGMTERAKEARQKAQPLLKAA